MLNWNPAATTAVVFTAETVVSVCVNPPTTPCPPGDARITSSPTRTRLNNMIAPNGNGLMAIIRERAVEWEVGDGVRAVLGERLKLHAWERGWSPAFRRSWTCHPRATGEPSLRGFA